MSSPGATTKHEPKCQGPDCQRAAQRPYAYVDGEPPALCVPCWARLTMFHRIDLEKEYREARVSGSTVLLKRQSRDAVDYLTQRKEPK